MKIEINAKSGTPLYQQIEEQLRIHIKEEAYLKGKLLPNEIILSKQLGVSRNTVRQAINNLVNEGLLTRKKGVGTIASTPPFSSNSKNWKSFSQEMESRGIEVRNYELHVTWEIVDEEIANFFRVEPSTRVLRMERVRGSMDNPFVYFISYFNPKIMMTGDEDFSKPLYELLEEKYNTVVVTSREEISACSANSYIAKKLEIEEGDPMLKRKRFVYDQGETPIEWNIGYYRADSFVYTVESKREIL